MIRPRTAALIVALTALCATSALAQQEMSKEEAFVASNVIHIMLHEAGHAVIDQFALPVIGQEEDAADSFATFEVIAAYEDHVDILLDAAEAMIIMHELDEEAGLPFDYFSVHDLDIQRGLRIVCHAVGIDPEQYDQAARWTEMDEDQRAACEVEAEIAVDSWDALLEPYLLEDGATAATIPVTLDDTERQQARAFLERAGLMNEIALYLGETFDWPRLPSLLATDCGEANAFYDLDTAEIVMCYEFVEELFTLASYR